MTKELNVLVLLQLFKIPNTLIALNEGIVTKDSLINWDKK